MKQVVLRFFSFKKKFQKQYLTKYLCIKHADLFHLK